MRRRHCRSVLLPIDNLLSRSFFLHLPNDLKEKSDSVPVEIILLTSVSKAAVQVEMASMLSLVVRAAFATVVVDEPPKRLPDVVEAMPKLGVVDLAGEPKENDAAAGAGAGAVVWLAKVPNRVGVVVVGCGEPNKPRVGAVAVVTRLEGLPLWADRHLCSAMPPFPHHSGNSIPSIFLIMSEIRTREGNAPGT